MQRQRFHLETGLLSALVLTGATLALPGCSGDTSEATDEETQAVTTGEGGSTPLSQLPFIDAASNAQLLGELLDKPTALGETTALQVRLPPPHNGDLATSLVRVIGEVDHPHVVFRSDALARLGVIRTSPG